MNTTTPGTQPGKRRKRRVWLLLIILIPVAVLLVLLGAVLFLFFRFYGKTNFVSDPDTIVYDEGVLGSLLLSSEMGEEAEDSFIEQIGQLRAERADSEKPVSQVVNFMIAGVDKSSTEAGLHTDTIVLLSVNHTKKTVTVTNLLDDTGVLIPDVGVRRLYNVFLLGGGPLLSSVMMENFGVPVDHYMWVDFSALDEVVDKVGGIDLAVSEEEALALGVTRSETGTAHLTGAQTLLVIANAYSEGEEYLTRRKQDVLIAVVNRGITGTPEDAVSFANAVLPYLTHNIESTKLMAMLTKLPSLLSYTFNDQQLPYDGLYTDYNGMMVPVHPDTENRWRAFVY